MRLWPRLLRVSFLLIASFCLLGQIFSQAPRIETKWWKDEKIRSELSLTAPQDKQLDKIMAEFRERLVLISRDLDAKRKERHAVEVVPTIHLQAYRTLTDQIYSLKEELDRVRTAFSIRLGEVLTPSQEATLRKIQSKRH
ncbi:MAG: hypothetical protein HYR55_15285 [Acidobacteria bacterium]|nr:hypothetical protein [Acidobacteriota bacterium]MBI3657749.1 hypothetical protein [Acidobacteriota bacterium]